MNMEIARNRNVPPVVLADLWFRLEQIIRGSSAPSLIVN